MLISRKSVAALIAVIFVVLTSVTSIRTQNGAPFQNELIKAAYQSPFETWSFLTSTQSIGSFPTFTGGFEDEAVGTPAIVSSIATGTQQTAWTLQNGSGTGTISSSGGRSGPRYLAGFGATAARRFQSPTAANQAIASSTNYVIQFFYRSSAVPANFGVQVGTDGTAGGTTTQPVTLTNTAGAWTKIAQPLISNSSFPPFPAYGLITLRYSGSSSNTADFDDVVVYPGSAADTTAPNAPTAPSVGTATNATLPLSWSAPASGGVDGGGYMVVRGTSDPTTAPNVNGIYKVGNTIASGQTVVYIGTGNSFTDTGLASGTQYFYRIYTVDKAFNYSSPSSTNGTTIPVSYTLTYSAGPNGSITGVSPQTVNSGASGSAVTAIPNSGYSFVNWSDGLIVNPRTDSNVASNISVTANFADQTAPETAILSAPTDPSNSSSAAFTFSGTDSGSGVASFECALDTPTFTTCSSGSSYPALSDGAHTFSVRAKDAAGNNDATPASYTWTVDTVGPVIQGYAPVASTTSNSAQNLTVIATDDGGSGIGAIKVWFSVNNGPLSSIGCVVTGSDNCSIPGQPDGTAVAYYIEATDNAGNSLQMPAVTAPNVYTVGPAGAAIPAGRYSNADVPAGSSLAGDVTVTGELHISGQVTTGANTLTLGCDAVVTGASSANYVIGTVRKDFCTAGAFAFPVGTVPTYTLASIPNAPQPPDEYSPVDVNVTSVNGPSSLTVAPTDTFLPGLTTATAASRYWTLTETGELTADLTFHYLAEDVNGDPNGYQIFRRENGVGVAMGGTVTPANNTAAITGVSNFSQWGIGATLAPTAGEVSLSGRVLTANGQGLKNAVITVSGNGTVSRLHVLTGPFGYYQIDGLAAGETYVVTIVSKSYTFAQPSRVVTLNDSLADVDFTAESQNW